ncbi:MAG TPA: NUDIX hydrolase [Candidatus Babeliales bacterium]|nr:NUDIX hydrolase [Candidatus Babeliales bacterium]
MSKSFVTLKQLLGLYSPDNNAEKESKERILTFLDHYPDAFERSLEVGHITASCWLLNKNNTHALLTHHRKLGMWIQLGGHCDGDRDVLSVAIKEAQEESGIIGIRPVTTTIFDIDVHENPESKKEKAHYHYDIRFLLQVISDEKIVVSDESHALAWVTKNIQDLPSDNPSVVRMFNKWINHPW